MPDSDPADRYTTTAVVLHWLIAVAVIGLIGWGWWMQTIPKEPVGPRVDAYNLHKSIGLSVLLLMLVRVAWRASHRPPAFVAMPAWQVRLARSVHILFYVCLLVQPLTGYLGSAFSGYPVKFFGIVLPAWAPSSAAAKDAMSVVHLLNSVVLVSALALHITGAARHALVDRDGSFWRIWPWRPRAAGEIGSGSAADSRP